MNKFRIDFIISILIIVWMLIYYILGYVNKNTYNLLNKILDVVLYGSIVISIILFIKIIGGL